MVATFFSPVQNRGKEPLHLISDHPFGPNEMGVSTDCTYTHRVDAHLPSDDGLGPNCHVLPCPRSQLPAPVSAAHVALQAFRIPRSLPWT